ncbi:polysaccharide lyase family 7 protein [Rhodopirellula sp. JC740]|uniref:Polysaccharide lyase family 7 protein n=1 Tax=Rhodopirellula halodulae TaxID=2894198 RepID=A0ABS8NMC9_9BACT|nr:polysaccharide lyase family 7 protein [Rhodopirellula sp. JC740]MCC9644744.1 polysaccharide lyase family 7 protein [Rhodopirellula sp. JC740]
MRIFVVFLFSIALCISTPAQAGDPPALVLDLSNWCLTLPIDSNQAGKPDEIGQPDLASFVDDRYFRANSQANGVVFRAHCGGVTTKGSKYPRCELREMVEDGTKRASWKTHGEVIHTMDMRVAITATPEVKPQVVCGQIHDADDDLIMIRLEGAKLFVERNSFGDVMLDQHYQLGTPFDVRIQTGRGTVDVWYNGKQMMSWAVSRSGCYFKAGCYTQSNISKGDESESFGEVVIYRLQVEHSD